VKPSVLLVALGALLLVAPAGSLGGIDVEGGSRLPLALKAASLIQEAKLVAGGKAQNDEFGRSLALSKDGSTALVGAPRTNLYKGAAWVFTRRAQTWTELKLSGSSKDPVQFGQSVALSANGRVALIGAPNTNKSKGAAWIFRTSGGGTWVGQQLTGKGLEDKSSFGHSVALSADGATALIGGPNDDQSILGANGRGAAWVFTRPGTKWTQQGGKLTGKGEKGRGSFGWSVALSGDGTTALIGGISDRDDDGAAWVFSRSGSKWTQQGPKLRRGTFGARFGFSVALSRDGSTALIGGPINEGSKGVAWVFTRSGSSWSAQARITGGGQKGKAQFGRSVSLSGDGTTALIGGLLDDSRKGAAWTFVRSGSEWIQQGPKLARGSGGFGSSVALSADGGRALITGGDVSRVAAWLFVNPPVVSAVNPFRGPTAGGTRVVIDGSGFTGVRAVTFGATPAASYTVDSPVKITAASPAGPAGPVDVRVRTSVGTSDTRTIDRFTYVNRPAVTAVTPSSGPSTGGTQVRVSGTDFLGATEVKFGTNEAQFKVDLPTQITAFAPPGQGTVDVTVTTPGGTSAANPTDRFTYAIVQTISFDNLTTGGPGGALVVVNSQYAGQGVTFNNVSAIDYAKGASAIPGFARSGSVGIEQCVGVEFCTTPIRATFSTPKTMVRVWVGFSFPLNQSVQVQLRAYAGSAVVGTANATLPAKSTPTPISVLVEVRLASASITQLEVSIPDGFNNALAVDDFTFEGP